MEEDVLDESRKRAAEELVEELSHDQPPPDGEVLIQELCSENCEHEAGIGEPEEALPPELVQAGDQAELEGLFNKGVLEQCEWSEVPKSARIMSSRLVRRLKRDPLRVKTRLVARDFRSVPPQGGELFASTPTLLALRVLLALESLRWHRARQQQPPQQRVVLGLDVTQAFIHAPIDEVFYLVVCDELEGLSLKVEVGGKSVEITLHAGDVLRVL